MKKRRKRHFRKPQADKKAGLPPGEIVYIGEDRENVPVKITVMDYNEDFFNEEDNVSPEACAKFKDSTTSTWINVNGIHNTELIEKLGKIYGINNLVLEDVANTNSRPKIDDFKDYLFVVVKMLTYDKEKHNLNIEQVSLILGKNYVISLQENEGDLFDNIRARLRDPGSRSRKLGPDYLLYSLMDKIVDEYFLIIESMGEELESLEDEVAGDPSREFLHRYNDMKQNSIYLRKSVWPLREVINYLVRGGEVTLVKPEVMPYFRDLYDHTVQVIDTIETYRDLFSDIMDVYLSTLSLRMNEVMKVLTIISTIFIPLTFIVGVYGMNFKYMPELDSKYGYYIIWAIMIVTALAMISYFRKKKWF